MTVQFNIANVIKDVVLRIASGETVRVKKQWQEEVTDVLEESGINYAVQSGDDQPEYCHISKN